MYQQFIHKSRYARWLDEEGRREDYVETIDRYLDFMLKHLRKNNNYAPPAEDVKLVRNFMLSQKAMPSMRAVMTAGPALERNNIAGYNCAYLAVDDFRAFDEALYILMNGTGVGFSVESRYVDQLQRLPYNFRPVNHVIVVEDSKEGWAEAFRELVDWLLSGRIPQWNTSKVRPAGSRLKTFGGRASGPEPLEALFAFTVQTFLDAAGRRLTALECHDLMCKVADIVVVGGVRRSALISLSDLHDEEMSHAKDYGWWENKGVRRLANNSVAYEARPSEGQFWKEWTNLKNSGSGERGIFNREAARKQAARSGRRDSNQDFGTNPCSEIILRSKQFCNLSEVVIRGDDDMESVIDKVRAATILGTWQSTLTNFKYIRDIWRKNTEEERLLGVSMTGQMGNLLFNGRFGLDALEAALTSLKMVAVEENARIADEIGIPRSAAITCVKPSGTVSQLVNAASGMHTWHSQYIQRTVRGDKKDPITQFMELAGVPCEDDVMAPKNTSVFSFPIAAPNGAATRNDLSAIEHLNIWLIYQRAWCEHKPSITISVKSEEWDEVGQWVWDHFNEISGISFLPYDGGDYKQAPYQNITKERYDELISLMPKNIDWSLLQYFESEDNTEGSQTFACSAGSCEVVDITK